MANDQTAADILDETIRAITMLDLTAKYLGRKISAWHSTLTWEGGINTILGKSICSTSSSRTASRTWITQPPVREKYERPMGTLTSVLRYSRQALMADQFALNVTANNVANQNTPGYTREVVTFNRRIQSRSAAASQSTGVTATVTSQRDRVLEQRVQQQTQVVGAECCASNPLCSKSRTSSG